MKSGIKSEKIDRALVLIRKGTTNYKYFFDQLTSPDWIQPLNSKGLFRNPPEPISKDNYIQFPIWPESRYLLRIVELVPDVVLDIALKLPDTDNARVHEDFTEAACKMPPNLAAKWAEKERKWVERQDHLYLNLSHYLGDLVQHLAEGGENTTALKLAKALLFLQPDPQYEDKVKEEEKHKESEFYLPYYPEPQVKCGRWEYEQVLKKNVPTLVMAGGIPVFKWLCKLLSTAIRLSRRHDEDPEKPVRDYSYIWRPAIEEHEQNQKHDIKDALIDTIRDAAERFVEKDSNNVTSIVAALEDKSLPWPIFDRIALHILRAHPSAPPELVKSHLLNRGAFENADLHHEYWLLARDKFDALTRNEQQTVIDWILSDEEEARDSFIERFIENKNQPPTEEETETYTHAWLRKELALIKDYLPSELRQRYEKAVVKVGEAEHPEFISYSSGGWVGPTSPKSSEELGKWSVQDLLAYLISWQPTGDWMTDSRDGLADAIAVAVGSQPEKYSEHCAKFYGPDLKLHPKYLRGLIEGFHEATRSDKAFTWHPVLDLCKWVVDQNRDFSSEVLAQEIGDGREETSWAWTRTRIANLLEEGLKQKKNVVMPLKYRDQIWSIIEELTNDPDPSHQNERRFMQPFDAATASINTVRGQAMHTVMYYVMWVRKHLSERAEGDEKLVLDFCIMPEVRDLLECRLDRRREKTLTIQSVYARWFPWLIAWDEEWAKKNKQKVFPASSTLDEYWSNAWSTYIVFNRPYDNVFRVLKRDYRKALQRLDMMQVGLGGENSVDESLAEHLMTFYWRGLIARKSNSLINQFFALASPELRGHAIGFIGDNIAHTDASIHPDIMQRFYDLWSWRLHSAKIADDITDYKPELMAFGKWFGTQKLQPIEWALEQLLQVLNIVERIDADEAMVKYLAVLAEKYPMKVIVCFRLMVLNETDGYNMWLWKEHGKRLLSTIKTGANLDARDQAIDLVHRLGAMGHQEFRDLLQD